MSVKEFAVTKPLIRLVSTSRKTLEEAPTNGSLFWNTSKTTLLSITIFTSQSLLFCIIHGKIVIWDDTSKLVNYTGFFWRNDLGDRDKFTLAKKPKKSYYKEYCLHDKC